jgi:hypothetical protein
MGIKPLGKYPDLLRASTEGLQKKLSQACIIRKWALLLHHRITAIQFPINLPRSNLRKPPFSTHRIHLVSFRISAAPMTMAIPQWCISYLIIVFNHLNVPAMKTLFSLVTLVTIVCTYILSASLYLQDQFFFSYALVLSSVLSLTYWIKSNDLLAVWNEKA